MADHDDVQDPGAELADEGIPPRDEPLGAEEFGTTAAEERRGESLADRVAREEPEVERPERHAGRLVEPGGDEGGLDADQEKDAVASTAGYDDGGYSAEEQAVHVRENPPGLT